MGNVDINMGRQARTKLSQFHDVPRGYSGELGPKKSFDAGFQEGLKAGYADGYAGRIFRAVDTLRLISQSLSQTPMSADSLRSPRTEVLGGGPRFASESLDADTLKEGQFA